MWVLHRSVTKLLEDLVYFVTGGTNSGQDVLEVVFSKPNRERQKLMREQNILKQVGWIVSYTRTCHGLAVQLYKLDEVTLATLAFSEWVVVKVSSSAPLCCTRDVVVAR